MADEKQLKRLLKEGVKAWNEWREKHPDDEIDLDKAQLEGANLVRANLEGANLFFAQLEGADFTNACGNEDIRPLLVDLGIKPCPPEESNQR